MASGIEPPEEWKAAVKARYGTTNIPCRLEVSGIKGRDRHIAFNGEYDLVAGESHFIEYSSVHSDGQGRLLLETTSLNAGKTGFRWRFFDNKRDKDYEVVMEEMMWQDETSPWNVTDYDSYEWGRVKENGGFKKYPGFDDFFIKTNDYTDTEIDEQEADKEEEAKAEEEEELQRASSVTPAPTAASHRCVAQRHTRALSIASHLPSLTLTLVFFFAFSHTHTLTLSLSLSHSHMTVVLHAAHCRLTLCVLLLQNLGDTVTQELTGLREKNTSLEQENAKLKGENVSLKQDKLEAIDRYKTAEMKNSRLKHFADADKETKIIMDCVAEEVAVEGTTVKDYAVGVWPDIDELFKRDKGSRSPTRPTPMSKRMAEKGLDMLGRTNSSGDMFAAEAIDEAEPCDKEDAKDESYANDSGDDYRLAALREARDFFVAFLENPRGEENKFVTDEYLKDYNGRASHTKAVKKASEAMLLANEFRSDLGNIVIQHREMDATFRVLAELTDNATAKLIYEQMANSSRRMRVIVDNLRSLRHDVDTAKSDYDAAYDKDTDDLINKTLVTIADDYRKVMVAVQGLDEAEKVAGIAEKKNPLEALTVECITLAAEVKKKREELKAADKAAQLVLKQKAAAFKNSKSSRSRSTGRSGSPVPKKPKNEGAPSVALT